MINPLRRINKFLESEESPMEFAQEKTYTIDDIYALPEGQRAELIDGQMYMMAPPTTNHQRLVAKLSHQILSHIDAKGGNCEVFPAPFAVFLNEDDRNYVEPDISVICDKNKLTDKGCNGAPDWVIEIVSPSTSRIDYGVKLFKYRSAGVREYWIVNPLTNTVNVYDFASETRTNQYIFSDDIPVCIYEDLSLNTAKLLS